MNAVTKVPSSVDTIEITVEEIVKRNLDKQKSKALRGVEKGKKEK